eukprot:GFYU01004134.1.p1 GENE.GFYU01004134.1~~GFYU01004134.1.p1  ORF type:complete len:662 (+),score=75.49 GFYU01004134.1:146-2131(+)
MSVPRQQVETVSVNCWFCNADFEVPTALENQFDCPYCEQYNGFDEDGGYNKVIPGQQYTSSPTQSRALQTAYQMNCVSPPIIKLPAQVELCQRCQHNQELLVKRLASYDPDDSPGLVVAGQSERLATWTMERDVDAVESTRGRIGEVFTRAEKTDFVRSRGGVSNAHVSDHDSDVDGEQEKMDQYRQHLEKLYALCGVCQAAVDTRLGELQQDSEHIRVGRHLLHSQRTTSTPVIVQSTMTRCIIACGMRIIVAAQLLYLFLCCGSYYVKTGLDISVGLFYVRQESISHVLGYTLTRVSLQGVMIAVQYVYSMLALDSSPAVAYGHTAVTSVGQLSLLHPWVFDVLGVVVMKTMTTWVEDRRLKQLYLGVWGGVADVYLILQVTMLGCELMTLVFANPAHDHALQYITTLLQGSVVVTHSDLWVVAARLVFVTFMAVDTIANIVGGIHNTYCVQRYMEGTILYGYKPSHPRPPTPPQRHSGSRNLEAVKAVGQRRDIAEDDDDSLDYSPDLRSVNNAIYNHRMQIRSESGSQHSSVYRRLNDAVVAPSLTQRQRQRAEHVLSNTFESFTLDTGTTGPSGAERMDELQDDIGTDVARLLHLGGDSRGVSVYSGSRIQWLRSLSPASVMSSLWGRITGASAAPHRLFVPRPRALDQQGREHHM